MTTLSTKTYLQLVNDTIDEAGTDLVQFATDGSDWDTQTDAMMNRFKKWVNRAWREIQQEANDWHWLDETAVITITPGVMFWSDLPIRTGIKDINPASIVDIDGSTYISGLTVDGVQDLTDSITGTFPTAKPFGYMDIRYSDYNPDVTTQGHVLDFGLKAGGFRITRENDGRSRFLTTFNSTAAFNAAGFVEVGDVVNSITVTDNILSTTHTYPFTDCSVDIKSVDGQFVTLNMSYADVEPDPFARLIDFAIAGVSDFSVTFSLEVATGNGNKTLSGTMRFDDIGNQYLLTGAITPLSYEVDFDAPIGAGTDIRIGDALIYTYNSTTHLGDTRLILGSIDSSIVGIYPTGGSAGGVLKLNVSGDTGISLDVELGDVQTYQTCWTFWASLLFATAPVCQANLPGILFYRADSYVNGEFAFGQGVTLFLYNTLTSTALATWTFDYQKPYVYKNYIHSWKSFDWDEETGLDDFVSNVRSTNNSTFRIISREDPGVSREVPLVYLAWDEFQNKYDLASVPPATPRVVSQDNTGRYRFYPPPDRPYTIVFDYIREPQELSSAADVCKGLPEEFEDMVMWRALQFYGEYDEQPSDAARGRMNYKNMLMTLQQENRPAFHFRPHRLY